MPVINIYGPKSDKETKKELIKNVSEIVSKAYNLPVEAITVVISETEPDNVGVGGKQLSEIQKNQ